MTGGLDVSEEFTSSVIALRGSLFLATNDAYGSGFGAVTSEMIKPPTAVSFR